MCKEACNSSLSFLSLFDIILRRQIKHEWIFFWHCHYYYSSSDIGFRRSSLFTKGIGTISRRIYRKSGVPRPFFNKQDIEKDLTKKEKYKFTKNKIPRFPQQKIRPNVLNARKDDCFQQDVSPHKGGSGLEKGENLDRGYWTRIWAQLLPRLQ